VLVFTPSALVVSVIEVLHSGMLMSCHTFCAVYGYGEVRATCTAYNLFPVHYPHSVEVIANQTIYNGYLVIIAYKLALWNLCMELPLGMRPVTVRRLPVTGSKAYNYNPKAFRDH